MYKNKYVAAIIVAAGRGTRMGAEIPKQYMSIAGKTILETTLYKFEKSNEVDEIILIVGKDDLEYVRSEIASDYEKITKVKAGGSTRTESVYEGIKAVSEDCGIVLIHDGVRPFVSYNLINSCVEGAHVYKACIPATDVVDTIKEVSDDNTVKKTLNRSALKSVQTPQSFEYDLIRDCYIKAMTEEVSFTDDASIVEYYGHKVKVIEGLMRNIKITTPLDLRIAEIFASIY
ncbi:MULTISPECIES: 2-C-methyl-D-erythritol 4-phosphate cytidylyltransferase [unclassified Sedimentibacter]|uniref:2-C-methyl-D-erythritol 4-phosphate cytidylyltransferase n=1 Tax=unclassified Sedimentibacter TaxID=2649220 RepID=UPI0027DF56DB|nr:2-C-methyl-D-erythritol 4-phosphate cytidylyltransferase [Sedimentibacter sp. MB35-C1]WMJ78661.1 2-C-methyl-D-erythritol 4-phosphate cytidylyltransferase [Sedimentibacter sp. MB35-C1]